jgi:hypothetical protein
MEVSGQLHAPVALTPGKSLRYPLDRRLGGPQTRSGQSGEDEKFHHATAGNWTPVVQSVAQSLHWLRSPAPIMKYDYTIIPVDVSDMYEGVSKIFRAESITK